MRWVRSIAPINRGDATGALPFLMANIQLRNFQAVKCGTGSSPLHPASGGKKGGAIRVIVANMKMLIPA